MACEYDSCCRKLARDGGRVMALAYRVLSEKEQLAVVQQGREAAEHGLVFAHTVVMITGDHVLTSCHVAKALRIVHRELLIASWGEGGAVVWTRYESDKSTTPLPRIEKPSAYDLCVPGDVLDDFLSDANAAERARLLPRVRGFARASPEQKERVVSAFRVTGHCVLGCGDGTNDVGALKQADVGIALLNVSDAPRPQQQQAPQPALELTPLPSAEFRARPVAVAVADVALSWLCDRVVMLVGRVACGKVRKKRC
eukprot:m51a1_g13041 putative probable cation-transporting atpase 13a1-like (255) ;mRNA; f:2042-2869